MGVCFMVLTLLFCQLQRTVELQTNSDLLNVIDSDSPIWGQIGVCMRCGGSLESLPRCPLKKELLVD